MSKKKQASQQNLSPKKYIFTRARSLSIYKCLINNDWLENKTASIIITRLHSNGNITAGFYFVDLLARGLKDTHYQFNVPHDDFFEELHQSVPEDFHEEVPYVLVHNIIYGAVSFAEDHLLPPHRDFEITQYILEEDTEEIELLDIEFGENGEPVFIDTDEEEDDEWEDELGDVSFKEEDFRSWSDDEWRNYFASEEANNDEYVPVIVNTLFDKWYREKFPFTQQHPAELKESSMRITFDALKKDYHKNEEELIEMEKVYEDLQENTSAKKLNEIEKKLHLMIALNPLNPILYNYMAICAQLKNNKQGYLKILNTTIEKFPDYLFSKIAMANIFIEEDRITEAETLLGSHYLSGLYPERYTFHFSEFIGFHSTLVRLFVAKNDIQQAVIHYDFLNEFDDEFLESSNIFTKAEQEFLYCKMNVVAAYMNEKNFV